MRPADENQHSTRPNLMSSGRRMGSDQSILELLDRDSGRGTRRKGRSRLGWYGLGGALATGLIGLLAWLTHTGPAPQEAQPVVVADTAGAVERAGKADPADDLANLSDLDDPPRPHHAAVVDEPPGRQSRPATATMPAPPPVTAASKGALVQDEPNAQDSSGPHPDDPHDRTLAAAPASAHGMQQNTAALPSAAPRRDAAKGLQPRAAADAPKGRSAIKLTQIAPRDEPRKSPHAVKRARKQAAPAKAAQPVDSDVALISAVIQHSTARSDADCADRNCAAKTTTQP